MDHSNNIVEVLILNTTIENPLEKRCVNVLNKYYFKDVSKIFQVVGKTSKLKYAILGAPGK